MATDKKKPADTGKPNTDSPAPKARATKRKVNMKRGESKHSERRIEAVEACQTTALEYRKMGLSYQQIAVKMQLGSKQTAWNMVGSALKRTLEEPAADVRKLELERLDALWIRPYGNALNGDTFAITTCLNIMNRRARLLGLDAPEKKELTGKDGKDLNSAPITILIGGPGEEGEPELLQVPPM